MATVNGSSYNGSPQPLFLYGTLLAPPLLAWLLTGNRANTNLVASITKPARLYGYSRTSLHGYDYPALVPASNATDFVDGLLLRPQTLSQRQKVDNFEGETYKLTTVTVNVSDESVVEAGAYVYCGDHDRVADEPWDPSTFVKERLEDWLDIFDGMEVLDDEGN
ncbi:unnamed protein product [Somion occarium]|uniref:Putative gamma-glutamylcyclotransferase n=1 Tax=Somion occarium TaxID=3059160 RepID=A0ABP1D7S1_9APHY